MITEDHVSFELAKLLKEKGFNNFTTVGWSSIDHTKEPRKFIPDNGRGGWYDNRKEWISRPSISLVMKWLRETFKIHCQITYTLLASGWIYDIHNLNKDEWWVTTFGNTDTYDTYEQACEAAIKYCLENLI